MKLGPRRNYHKGRAAIRHYANQPTSQLVGAFSVIVQLRRLIVYSTTKYWPAHKQWLWAKQLGAAGAGHSCVAQQCIVTRGPGSRSTDMLNLTPADPHRAVTVTYTTFFRDTNSHSRFVYWHSLLALIASELVCEHGHFYSTPIMQNMGAWGQIERGSWLDHVLIIAFQHFCTKQTLPASQQNISISSHFPHSTSS